MGESLNFTGEFYFHWENRKNIISFGEGFKDGKLAWQNFTSYIMSAKKIS